MIEYIKKFLNIKYSGNRFDGGRLPVDVVSDLQAIEDILATFAREIWLRENDRDRMPNGYTEWFKINLTGIEEGSALPALELNVFEDDQFPIEENSTRRSLMHKAELEFYRTLKLASESKFATLSPAQIRNFNRFLPNLQQDEKFHCSEDPEDLKLMNSNVISLDVEKRTSFLKNIKSTYEQRVQGIALLKSVDVKCCIKLSSKEIGEFSLTDIDKDPTEYGSKIGSYYQFDLSVERRHDDIIQQVFVIHELALLEHPIIPIIEKIAQLNDGWLDGYGNSVDSEVVLACKEFIIKKGSKLPNFYAVAPTEEGNILFEYRQGSWDYGIEFTKNGLIFFGIDIDSEEEISRDFASYFDPEFSREFDKSFLEYNNEQ